LYKIRDVIKEVRGRCALGYKTGDKFIVENHYIPPHTEAHMPTH